MIEVIDDPWLAHSCELVERLMLAGLRDRVTRYAMMREAISRGRKGALHYHGDHLVGFVHGLVRSLFLLGVRPELLKFGEVPYESCFFGTKRWDYLLQDASGRPVVRIEMACASGKGVGFSDCLAWEMPGILGMLYDHRSSGQGCFAGLVVVQRLRPRPTRPKMPVLTARWTAKRHARLGTFFRRLRASGLVDRTLFIEECEGKLTLPLPDATTATFLSGVRDVINRHPELMRPMDTRANTRFAPTG